MSVRLVLDVAGESTVVGPHDRLVVRLDPEGVDTEAVKSLAGKLDTVLGHERFMIVVGHGELAVIREAIQ